MVYKVGFANICKESLLFTFSVCVPFVLLFVSTVMNVLLFEKLRDGEREWLCPLLNPTKQFGYLLFIIFSHSNYPVRVKK